MMNVIVTGIGGRMGSAIAKLIHASSELKLAGSTTRDDRLERIIGHGDVIIDFTTPIASVEHARLAALHGIPIVIGTTGFAEEEQQAIAEAARETPIILSSNMSIGVNLLFALTVQAARSLGKDFSLEIVETHHLHKKDRPSGTARELLNIVLTEQQRPPDDVAFHEDGHVHGKTDAPIHVRSIRSGEVIGDHTVHFTSAGEALILTHHAMSRDIFAKGALTAARWLVGKAPGLYSMKDVLSLE